MDSKMLNMLEELEVPKFTSCSFFAYSLSDQGEVVVLMRSKKDSKNAPYYVDFGTTLKEYPGSKDVNIVFAAARSFISKTGGICLASELELMTNPTELAKRINDYILKSDDILYIHNHRIKEVFTTVISSQMVVECLSDMPHVAFFYPLPYWRLDSINKVYSECEKYHDLSLHWIPLTQIA